MIPSRHSPPPQPALISALCDPRCYPHAVKQVKLIETHISWVLLAGRYAYKIKKPLDLGFLNYATLSTRRFCCEEEIRLNRRTAPGIYLDVVPIGGSPDRPEFGAQPAIEYAVRMRRFASASLLDHMLHRGKLTRPHIDSLAAGIARFHAGLPAAPKESDFGTPAAIRAAALQNFAQLHSSLADATDRARIAALQLASTAEFTAGKKVFATRHAQGFVRECHGDLHLGNIMLVGDKPVPFDGIEFNPALRWIDVLDEVAFTVMDLLHAEETGLAWRMLNAYLEESGDYAGVAVLRFYLAFRATVRAKVCAIRSGQAGIARRINSSELAACRSYLAQAMRTLAPPRPALIITHGLPGSGKTTFSQLLLEQLGAVRIRSDVERKRLFGLQPLQSSRARAGDIYTPAATQKTYARLYELARELLVAGYTVVVDAAFLKREERSNFRSLAQSLSVPCVIASLQADETVLRERLRQRRNDASEADVAVLNKLRKVVQPLSARELACSASFTTEEAPDSVANTQAWNRLNILLAERSC